MKDRLNEIIEKKGLTATKFANMIDVNPSAISHLLKGRNKPGYDVLVNIAKAFPDISMDWLLTGKGGIYNHPATAPSVDIQEKTVLQTPKEPEHASAEKEIAAIPGEIAATIPLLTNKKALKRIILFFSDGSFEDYQKD
ncbi:MULTISPECIES: helix-turn-helix domain-containing protein [Culturomica]|uniref:helix-turn-helix domain-containing protein n=1 Tax=Culturomica TaxID=1926651 RepID=UPI000338E497|nr:MULTISPECIES: helix-turn-helix domain-containing protein [Culturomica]CCZ06287.1 putative uncharacterized protein [Odoribacter sp. CAG:788]HBO27158.1 XRE family transcriptional regulator [Culturomica sp.]